MPRAKRPTSRANRLREQFQERAKLESELDWQFQVQLSLQRKVDEHRLYVGLQKTPSGEFLVLALESAAKVDGTDDVADGKAVLDQHSHDVIGVYPFGQAVIVAEDYVLGWKPGKKPDCTCTEIGAVSASAAADRRPRRRPARRPSAGR